MRAFLTIPFTCLGITALATAPKATFTENKGQWPEQVLYRALIPGGALFVERSAFTYVLHSGDPSHHHGHQTDAPEPGMIHAYRVHFEGGHAEGAEGSLKQSHYENYFLGNDPTHWGTRCGVFGEVVLRNIWPGIDMRISGREGIKYDFIVASGVDPGLIRMRYEGQDGLVLKDGALHVRLSNGEIVEEHPVSWVSLFDGVDNMRTRVPSKYRLSESTVSFDVEGSTDLPLTIDPVLTFSSYSGSTADNFGFTATYDATGHLYGGGIVFGVGYPVTLGVQQEDFGGDVIDMGITKFSPDGSTLVWSTYLGGALGNETPHSMVVNSSDELYVMGVTGATDFPVTAGCMDGSFAVGPPVNFVVWEGYVHNEGTDVVIAHLSSDATQLLGSTFVGGTESDGLNLSSFLDYNYADPFRGEIILDELERPVVATSTHSMDMPISASATQPTLGGSQDGYACMLDPGLTSLLWGTYYGGTLDDAAFGVQQAGDGRIYITGGTRSTDLPMAGTPHHPAALGGGDGYVACFTPNGNALLATTYLGTPAYDQSYFVQIDLDGGIYVVGQTRGAYPVSAGVYANPSGSQFIHKLNHDLSASIWSTRIGSTGTEDISPSAFLVSDCGLIYFSGWGGSTNNLGQPNASTTNGLPVSADAYQSSTDGSDFYLMVLNPNAVSLAYATFFGGSSAEHVDGGTSRFDKNGSVYQAVCAGCNGSDDFPTTPGAWSNTNNSFNCNLGVFKFDLAQAEAVIGIDGPGSICFPATAQFTNTSVGGTDYFWDFGDGDTSTAQAPSHLYDEEGVFIVTMILTDSSACLQADTASIEVTSLPPPEAVVDEVDPICPGLSTQLHAAGGDTYLWTPSTGLDDPTIADPLASPAITTTYIIIVSGECGNDTAAVEVQVIDPQAFAFPDTSVCLGDNVGIGATGGGTYDWSPAGTLSDPASATPIATPLDTTTYTVVITSPDGCVVTDSLVVIVYSGPPEPGLLDTVICSGTSLQLHAPDALSYVWQPADGIVTLDIQDPIVTPTTPTIYAVELINACGNAFDEVFVDLIFVNALAWPDTIVCPGQPVELHAIGGLTYDWAPAEELSDPDSSVTTAVPSSATTYMVTVIDANGCIDTATTYVELYPLPTVYAGRDMVTDWYDPVQLMATGTGVFTWSPPNGLDCTQCQSPIAMPEESIAYTVMMTDTNGCVATDQVIVIINGTLYLPNTFTPDGDGYNDGFGAWGKDIKEIELLVFNRWGELIWSTAQLNDRWDGTYNGVESPIDTYVWRVKATELSGRLREAIGHVNLLR